LHRADGPGGEVLSSALGAEFEAELRRIYDRARTLDEVTAELRALRDKVAEERSRFVESHTRTAGIIEERFDQGVQSVFKLHKEAVPAALAELDRDLASVVLGYLDAMPLAYSRTSLPDGDLLRVPASPMLPPDLRAGITAAIGPSREHTCLHLSHPLVIAAVAAARMPGPPMSAIVTLPDDASVAVRACAGRRGRLRLVKLSFDGFERAELLVPVVVLEGGAILPPELGDLLLRGRLRDSTGSTSPEISNELLEDATEETLFSVQSSFDSAEQKRFEAAQRQAERFVEDRLFVLKRRGRALVDRLEQAQHRRDSAVGGEARTTAEAAVLSAQASLDELQGSIDRMEQRDDPTFRAFQEHIRRRRYAQPRVEHVFDLDLVIE
ncbi:MAG: hypothetical protein WCJ30_01870, partial [Deltaproteobacteria bacterium]